MFALFPLAPRQFPERVGWAVTGKWAQVDTVHKMDLCHSRETLS